MMGETRWVGLVRVVVVVVDAGLDGRSTRRTQRGAYGLQSVHG